MTPPQSVSATHPDLDHLVHKSSLTYKYYIKYVFSLESKLRGGRPEVVVLRRQSKPACHVKIHQYT